MNGYVCIYKGKRIEVYADTKYEAQCKAMEKFKVKQGWKIVVVLAEHDGNQVTHLPLD